MPTELQAYFEKNGKEQQEIVQSAIKKTTGDATRSFGSVYISGAVAALVGAVAIVL